MRHIMLLNLNSMMTNVCEVFRALAALAQPASFENQYFRNTVGLFFIVVSVA